jgi:hypothetical protein
LQDRATRQTPPVKTYQGSIRTEEQAPSLLGFIYREQQVAAGRIEEECDIEGSNKTVQLSGDRSGQNRNPAKSSSQILAETIQLHSRVMKVIRHEGLEHIIFEV